jgi:phospholipid-binding lipoprotein MlaA
MRTTNIKCLMAGLVMAGMLGGCATQTNKDPLEGLNRGIYKFNDTVDKAAVKPIAGAYKAVLPPPVRTGVNNFFANLGTVVTIVNDLLQFKLNQAMDDTGRLAINTTFGIGGLIDWASQDGIERHKADFGQTMAKWGWKDSTYVVLPFLGPSTVRDAGGWAADVFLFDPVAYVDGPRARNQLWLTRFVDTRASYLPGSDLLDEAALDPYAFMRDAYLQRRKTQIYEGEVPPADTGTDADDGQ